MSSDQLIAAFQTEADAFRAATQLRAAGLDDDHVVVTRCHPTDLSRDEEVGVPDASASLEGLRAGEADPTPAMLLTISSLEEARLRRADIVHMIEAAGGRLETSA